MPAQGAETVRVQPAILAPAGLETLLAALTRSGYRIIGPRLEAGAITLGDIDG